MLGHLSFDDTFKLLLIVGSESDLDIPEVIMDFLFVHFLPRSGNEGDLAVHLCCGTRNKLESTSNDTMVHR